MRENVEAADEILDLYFPVLDGGFIALKDYMGTDIDIERAARVSYGKGTRKVSDTTNLLRKLFRDKHLSPFEMVSAKFHLRMPLHVIQQLLRHRTAKINQESHRYTEVTTDFQKTKPSEWRMQATDNKQGSSGFLPVDNGSFGWTMDGKEFSREEQYVHDYLKQVYDRRITSGMAREQARKDIPVSTYSTLYWKCDLRNIFNLLSLRTDSHAQLEIRQYANIMAGMIHRLCPITYQAWLDYSFCSRSFSRLELDFLSVVALYSGSWEEKRKEYEYANGFNSLERSKLSKREYGEFWTKLNTPEIPSFDLDLSGAKTIEEIQGGNNRQ